MKKLFLQLSPIVCLLFIASGCSTYGDKVEVNSKSTVYYKDGGTKEQAQKVGSFLLRNNYFDDSTSKSVQVTKSNDTSIVRFVVDEEKMKSVPDAELIFSAIQFLLKDSVFNGKPTRVVLANDVFDDIKVIKDFDPELNVRDANTTAPLADSSANQQ